MAHLGSPKMRYAYEDGFDNCKEDSTTDKVTDKENELPSDIRYRPTNLCTFPPRADLPTKTLLHATSSTPAITLTRYGSVPSPTATYEASPQTSVAQPESSQSTVRRGESITIVHAELNEYFEALKREFEDKTGRMWVRLEPVKYEEWDWELDDAVENINDDMVELATDFFLKCGNSGLDDADLDLDDFKWNNEGDDTFGKHAGEMREEGHLERTTVRV